MTKDETLKVKERFLNDVQHHTMEILLDDGMYRHIKFKNPKTFAYYFEIITFPGGLLYRGDMGCYEFERVPDMFTFFRDDNMEISAPYWSEKCQAEARFGRDHGIYGFKSDPVKKSLYAEWAEYFEVDDDGPSEVAKEVRQRIDDAIEFLDRDSEWQWIAAVANIRFRDIDTHFDTSDLLECLSDGKVFTHHFIWCCYALVWGINKYDLFKKGEKQ